MSIRTKAIVLVLAGVAGAMLLLGSIIEMRTSTLQSCLLSRLAKEVDFRVKPGKSPNIRFPQAGPYDQRLGYVAMPSFFEQLAADGFAVEAQARFSPRLLEFTEQGLFPLYHEKTQAGLRILDRTGQILFKAGFPERVFPAFEVIPDLVVQSLLFIENRELLESDFPRRNPAVEWDRMANAMLHMMIQLVVPGHSVPGGSTLATQIEKFRHSPEGVTGSALEKLRQMVSASLRAYMEGEETLEMRRRIVLDYINSMPLAAIPDFGEVIGLGDGLWAWYGAELATVSRQLGTRRTLLKEQELAAWALAYKQVLSLFIAQRRPSFYLVKSMETLQTQTDTYLHLLAQAGLISPQQRDAALAVKLEKRRTRPVQKEVPFVERKAANSVRTRLSSMLDLDHLYELDRLDLEAVSTLDQRTQTEVTKALLRLQDPAQAQAAGLREFRLLEQGDPSKVVYSFTLYECSPGGNLLRVQTDNFNQPLNINEGVKLELGSSAKLRTLVSYLEIVAALHSRYADLDARALDTLSLSRRDRLSGWAVSYLARAEDRNLKTMLEAALGRSYSASPAEEFSTGGGLHTFANFDSEDDNSVMPVREAFRRSVNLVFIRLMRDIVRYYIYQKPEIAEMLESEEDTRRQDYLERFADREGRIFLNKYYNQYRGKKAEEIVELLLDRFQPTPARLAAVFRYLEPEDEEEVFTTFMRGQLPQAGLTDRILDQLYVNYAPTAYSLVDRAYIVGVHPLDLWVAAYLRRHPQAGWGEVAQASQQERQDSYTWLFKTSRKNRQDKRIMILLEVEAFQEIHRQWKQVGYPFEYLTPSYATAIGSSGDRPAALAELVGIIQNKGIKYPSVRVQKLRFAEATPYETYMKYQPSPGEQVLRPEVAEVVRQALVDVAENGTAQRVKGVFVQADGQKMVVGGKTGTGDNRQETYGAGGRLLQSKVVSRTATFVFLIGERFFGVITAYVQGSEAAHFKFTSALPVQVLKVLAPSLAPLLQEQRRLETGI